MKLSENGRGDLKGKEGCKLVAYRCPDGKPTIGWGMTQYPNGKPVQMGDTLRSVEYATELFEQLVSKYEKIVNDAIKAELTQDQFDVLFSFAYNTGGIGDTLKSAINNGNVNSIPYAFHMWDGVTKSQLKPMNDEQKRLLALNKGSIHPCEGVYNRRDLEVRKFMGWDQKNVLL